MTIVKGKNVTIEVFRDDAWTWIGCAVSVGIAQEAEQIPITTISSGREDEYAEGGAINATIDFSGATTLDVLGGWQFEDWMDNIGKKFTFRIMWENSYGDILAYEMTALITSVSNQSEVQGFSLFDVSMIRSGAMTKTKEYGESALLDSEDQPIIDSNGVIIRG
jgi:hypothetical protein